MVNFAMNMKDIEENAIAQKYASGQLTPQETEAFELYLLENPQFVEQLELDAVLAKGVILIAKAPAAVPRKRAFWWFITGLLSGGAGVFALSLLVMPLFTAVNEVGDTSQIAYLETVRGETSNNMVVIENEHKTLILVLDTGKTSQTAFSASLASDGNHIIKSWQRSQSDSDGQAVLLVDTELLQEGHYEVAVEALGEQVTRLTYELNVARSP